MKKKQQDFHVQNFFGTKRKRKRKKPIIPETQNKQKNIILHRNGQNQFLASVKKQRKKKINKANKEKNTKKNHARKKKRQNFIES